MITLQKDTFRTKVQEDDASFLTRLDLMFSRVYDRFPTIPLEIREFIDASSGAVSRLLPDGTKQPDKDYYFQKIDSSGNAVTITAFGTQTINGSSTYSLSAQYSKAYIMWDPKTLSWYVR